MAGQGVAILGPFPPRPGGVSVQCELLAETLQAEGVTVERINTDVPAWRRHKGILLRALFPFRQVLQVVLKLWYSRKRWQVLHVHAASWWGFMPAVIALLALWGNKRLVLTYHGGEAAAFLDRFAWLARPVLGRYHLCLVLTPTQGSIFAAHGIDTRIVPNFIPIARFPGRLRESAQPHLIWVRQLEPQYRPQDALQVLALVKSQFHRATLTMCGGGSLLASLKAQGVEMGLSGITFTGFVDTERLANLYDQMGIFLNTSAVDNLPLTLIEASASGLPIVTTTAGAIPDLIQHEENGLLADVGDVETLSDHVLRLLADAPLAKRLSQAALLNAQRYTWPHIKPDLWRAYGFAQGLT